MRALGDAFVDVATGKRHVAGRRAVLPAPLGRCPLLAREGAAFLVAGDIPLERPHDAPARTLIAFPGPGSGQGGGRHVEDDGETMAWRDGAYLELALDLAWTPEEVRVGWRRIGGTLPPPPATAITIEVPTLAGRRLVVTGPA